MGATSPWTVRLHWQMCRQAFKSSARAAPRAARLLVCCHRRDPRSRPFPGASSRAVCLTELCRNSRPDRRGSSPGRRSKPRRAARSQCHQRGRRTRAERDGTPANLIEGPCRSGVASNPRTRWPASTSRRALSPISASPFRNPEGDRLKTKVPASGCTAPGALPPR